MMPARATIIRNLISMATDQKYRVAGRTATFRPPLWATLAVIPVIGLCVAAGFWQLGRAEAKRQLFATFDAASQERLADGPVPDEHAAAYRYQYLTGTGRYDADRQVLLDNMVYKGRVGYQVLTPLRTGNKAVLVNRGWIAADSDRSRVPTLAVDDQQRPVRGRLNLLPRPGLRLESPPQAIRSTTTSCSWIRRSPTGSCVIGGQRSWEPKRISATPPSGSPSP